MFGRLTLLLIGLVALVGLVSPQSRRAIDDVEPGNLIDIDTELGKEKEEVPEESGSGSRSDDEDDEDLDKSSGSGSGYMPDEETDPPVTTTLKSLTPCENLREASKHLLGRFVPRCTENGDYAAMQCRGYPGTGRCWCTDTRGAEIPGTAMDPPKTPDCENGDNLSPCVFKFTQHLRNAMYGSYAPSCTMDGEFEDLQCHGSVCFCVNPKGEKIYGTEISIGLRKDYTCPSATTEKPIVPVHKQTVKATPKPATFKPIDTDDPVYSISPSGTTSSVDHVITKDKDSSEEQEEEDDNETGDDIEKESTAGVASAHIMTQPGLLAAIIGGAVVGLLCAILLVMFIVYRMRKKDEGSYALDEPRKKSSYSPINTTDKEYYA